MADAASLGQKRVAIDVHDIDFDGVESASQMCREFECERTERLDGKLRAAMVRIKPTNVRLKPDAAGARLHWR